MGIKNLVPEMEEDGVIAKHRRTTDDSQPGKEGSKGRSEIKIKPTLTIRKVKTHRVGQKWP